MEGDEDTIMSGTGHPRVIPIGAGRPSSTSPVRSGEVSLEVNGSKAASTSSLINFQQSQLLAPPRSGAYVQQMGQTGTPTPSITAQMKSMQTQSEGKMSSDEVSDSVMEDDSDFDDDEFIAMRGLPVSSRDTGICYDTRMRFHCEVRPTADVHPEDPRRIFYIYKELCRAGLFDDEHLSIRPLVKNPMKRIKIRNATREEICLVHTSEHYDFVYSTQCKYSVDFLRLLPKEQAASRDLTKYTK